MGSNSARLDALERAVARRWIELAELKIALDELKIALDELKIALDASAANVAKTASVMFAQLDEIARTTREEVAAAKRDAAEARSVLEDDM